MDLSVVDLSAAWFSPGQLTRALAERGRGFALLVIRGVLTILVFFSFATSRLEDYTLLILSRRSRFSQVRNAPTAGSGAGRGPA